MRYKISDLAKLLGVSTNTVRRYEDMGYISAVRDENSGYRYYDDDGVFGVLNAKMHIKYGFTHEQISKMQNYTLDETIEACQEHMQQMDRQIAYMTYLRHRLKDDCVLMNKAATNTDIYEKQSLPMYYVLYKNGGKLLQEPERLEQLSEFLYNSPEIQHIYIIPESEMKAGRFTVSCGYSIKEEHLEKYHLHINQYAQKYIPKPSVMGISKVPARLSSIYDYSQDEIKEIMIGRHLAYMKEHNLVLDGDITGMVITSGSVDINNSNDQVLTYTVEDKAHNKTEAKRTIKMVRRDSPGTIYLTFDDGPNYGTTNVILDILKEENVKATFFVTGKGPDELIKREYDEGHTVALHTFSHNYQTVYQSVDAYFNDLTKVHDRVASITGYDSRIIRFPGGSSNTISRHYQEGIMTTLTKEVIEKGYYYYDWNISSGDAGEYKDSRSIINQVTRNLSKERTNMVLMHDIKPYTRDALREIIKYGKENGYHFDKITSGTKMIRQKVNN